MSEINPNVAKAAMHVAFDAAEYTWVDIHKFDVDEEALKPVAIELSQYSVQKFPLLFERLAVIPPSCNWDDDAVITVQREGGRIICRMWAFGHEEYAFQATIKEFDDASASVVFDFDIPKANYETLLHTFKGDKDRARAWMSGSTTQLLTCLYCATISTPTVTETYSCPPNPSNAKRKRKGKLPLYEWKTIVIDKAVRKRIEKMLHEAKPREKAREHEVRGHWAVSKLGKKYWRKGHKRGDASKGTIFHDYQTQGENNVQ